MKHKPLVIIEISDHWCKILRAKPIGQDYQITGLTTVRIADPSREALIKLISSQKIPSDRAAQCIAVLARRQVILKNLSFPSQTKEELKKMIGLQIATQVPYAKEDIVLDYSVLGQDAAGHTKTLVAVVHRETVEEFFKIFGGAGLTISQLILSSASIVSWANQNLASELKEATSSIGLLSIEADASELCLVKERQFVYSREIKHGLRDIGGDFENAFLKDLSLTMESFIREHPQEKIGTIFVLSAPFSSPLFDRIKAQGQIDVRFVDPATFLKKNEMIVLPQDQGDDYVSPVACWGAVQEFEKPTFNFLPEQVRKDRQGKVRQRQVLIGLALIFANLVMVGGLLFQQFYKDEAYLASLRDQIAAMRSRAEEVQRQEGQIAQIEQNAVTATSAIDIVDSLYAMTPKAVSFQLLFLDRNNRLTIQGIAENRSEVNDFQRSLIANSLFQDVNLEYAAQRRFFEGEITDFKITATVARSKERP